MSAALEVSETRIYATGAGSSWWQAFRQVHHAGRITVVDSSLGGETVSVACDDTDHAEWLRDTAIANGIPKTALKVRKDTRPTQPKGRP